MNSEKHVRICMCCKSIISGRSDKKFCDDQCRNSYNNQNKAKSTIYMKDINNILRRNRSILALLSPEGKTKISKLILSNKGFNFNYFTHQYLTKKGNLYHFCYDYGYFSINEDYVYVVLDSYADKE
jgi:hypothetical protein